MHHGTLPLPVHSRPWPCCTCSLSLPPGADTAACRAEDIFKPGCPGPPTSHPYSRATPPTPIPPPRPCLQLSAERIYWDQASVLVQLGLLDPSGLPVTGAEQADKVVAVASGQAAAGPSSTG